MSGVFVVDVGAFDVLVADKGDFVAKDGTEASVARVTLVVDVRRLKEVTLSVGFSVTRIVVVRRWTIG